MKTKDLNSFDVNIGSVLAMFAGFIFFVIQILLMTQSLTYYLWTWKIIDFMTFSG